MIQASSEHPLAKAILAYARHFHFFDDSSDTTGTEIDAENDAKSGWLFDVSDFSALPGIGPFIELPQLILYGNRSCHRATSFLLIKFLVKKILLL